MIDRMMDRRGLDNFDLRFLGLIFAILGIGVLSIYSVTHDQGGPGLPFFCEAGALDSAWGCCVFDHAGMGLSPHRTISVSCLRGYPDLARGRAL